jgi:hypothetical protein
MRSRNPIAAALLGIPLALGIPGCDGAREEERLRETVLSYLARPRFSNSDFMEQITGTEAELRMYMLDEGMLYLSIPIRGYRKEDLAELSDNPEAIEFGKTKGGDLEGPRLYLGGYVLKVPGSYFFRFPADDFRIDPEDKINIHYRSADYGISLEELDDFLSNESIYGGYLSVDMGKNARGGTIIFANHGAYVAKRGESSLGRLVDTLVPEGSSVEETSQILLDFVTGELEYLDSDANFGAELLKKPNEVLMTRGSDCTGKVILYASLLEQTDVDYRIAYIFDPIQDNHVTVAVEGEYGNFNGMSFGSEGNVYSIAETTTEGGFRIGQTRLERHIGRGDIDFIQKPGRGSKVYDARTGKARPFF